MPVVVGPFPRTLRPSVAVAAVVVAAATEPAAEAGRGTTGAVGLRAR